MPQVYLLTLLDHLKIQYAGSRRSIASRIFSGVVKKMCYTKRNPDHTDLRGRANEYERISVPRQACGTYLESAYTASGALT